MKDEFLKYLESIGMTKTLCKRVETIYEFYKEICPDKITGIFVTDYIKGDGSREYENLWFFSTKYCMEAANFITADHFDMAPIAKRVFRWEIKKQDYDFKKATEKSRLSLEFDMSGAGPGGVSGYLKASKGNCDHLKDIILKYVVPNLIESEIA